MFLRLLALTLSIVAAFSAFHVNAQAKPEFEFSPQTAKPIAKMLMKEDFFWSPIDDSGPFGSDAGSDAAYGYYKWRNTNLVGTPISYLKELLGDWNFPPLKWDELDTIKLNAYIAIEHNLSEAEIQRNIALLKKTNAASDPKQLSDVQLRQIVISSSKGMGLTFLVNIDQAIVGTAFAQIVLDGKLDAELRRYANVALQREMLPLITHEFGATDQVQAHNIKMKKMLQVIAKIPS